MISGKMYFHRDPKMSLSEIVRFLIDLHKIKDIKRVLVHPLQLEEEMTLDNIEITPQDGVIAHHFWFISENNLENRPEYGNFEK